MNIRQYLLSSVYRSPDEPAAPEPEPAAIEPAAEPEPASEPEPEPAPVPRATAPAWALERLGEETGRRQQAEERERAKDARIAEYEAIIQRLQTQPKPADGTAPAPAAPKSAQPSRDEFESAVQREAAARSLQTNLQSVVSAGEKHFGAQEWANMNAALNAYGINTIEFVSSVMDVDHARTHQIMHAIAQDGEQAVRLSRMSPIQRIAAITRIADNMAAAETKADPKADPKPEPKAEPKAPAVSRAPAPKPALAAKAPEPEVDPMTPEGNEKMSPEAWNEWYKKTYYGPRKTA